MWDLTEDEIAKKIETALQVKGYYLVTNLAEADYLLLFSYGIDQGSTHSQTHSYSTGGGYELNIFTGQLEKAAPTTHVGSTVQTTFTRQLQLSLYDAKEISEKTKPMWIGEVYSKGNSSDLRNVIDYLILGAFEHFGEDTGQQKTHIYYPSDSPIKKKEQKSETNGNRINPW